MRLNQTIPENRRHAFHRRCPFPAPTSPSSVPLKPTAANMLPASSASSSSIRRSLVVFCFFIVASLSCFVLLRAAYLAGFRFPDSFNASGRFRYVFPAIADNFVVSRDEYKLERVLRNAAMKDGTVILTTLNEAWAAPNSIIDLFLESFRVGEGTSKLLNHLVIIALDGKAFSRCVIVHIHCFSLSTEGIDFSREAFFMTPDYLKMMWRRIDFLRSVLELGYNFVFSDADVMWFRDPFPQFYLDADFQIACDQFNGNPADVENRPNGGYNFVRSSNQTIEFYKFWYDSQNLYPGYHDQDVLNAIKFDPFIADIGLKMRFLSTTKFGGFCEPSKDLNKVCTMHSNCCVGLGNKLRDLRIMLEDWKEFMSRPPRLKMSSPSSWRVPRYCSMGMRKHNSSGSPEQQVEDSLTD